MRYQVMNLKNGFYGVKDTQTSETVAAGFAEFFMADKWAQRLNLRNTWGI